jgi:hypothetical protein
MRKGGQQKAEVFHIRPAQLDDAARDAESNADAIRRFDEQTFSAVERLLTERNHFSSTFFGQPA